MALQSMMDNVQIATQIETSAACALDHSNFNNVAGVNL